MLRPLFSSECVRIYLKSVKTTSCVAVLYLSCYFDGIELSLTVTQTKNSALLAIILASLRSDGIVGNEQYLVL